MTLEKVEVKGSGERMWHPCVTSVQELAMELYRRDTSCVEVLLHPQLRTLEVTVRSSGCWSISYR